MATFEGVRGQFWTPENPDVRVIGVFTAKIGERTEATLEGRLTAGLVPGPRPVPVRPGDMASVMKSHAAGSVARFRAISFQGQLDTGELVTLLDANDHGRPGGSAHYIAPLAVIGAHVSVDHIYNAIRFRLDDPFWLSHLADGASAVVEDDQSILRVEASSDGIWLVYESATPATLRQLEMRAVSGCLALAQLALFPDKDLVASETHIRIESDSAWLPLHGPAFCAEPDAARLDTLLPPKELTIERFARWIELNDRFDGLAWAVARKMEVPVQLQVQLLTSLVEGFHRRLTPPEEQTRFPGTSKAALKRVREAAAKTAADQAEQEGIDRI